MNIKRKIVKKISDTIALRDIYHEYLKKRGSHSWDYVPTYLSIGVQSNLGVKVYSSEGKELINCFLACQGNSFDPSAQDSSKYLHLDRFNWGLPIHFYVDKDIYHIVGTPEKKYAMLVESKSIDPEPYEYLMKNRNLAGKFDAIFTYDGEILETFDNAKYWPSFCASNWYRLSEDKEKNNYCYQKKDKLISCLSSDKLMCHMHEVRFALANKCKQMPFIDTYGTFDGGVSVTYNQVLSEYMFSFAIENEISDYFFTERLISCFAAQTVPIYLGAKKIDKFFNTDGMILVTEKDLENPDKIIQLCSEEEYKKRLPAILDNYERYTKWIGDWDWLYMKYLSEM